MVWNPDDYKNSLIRGDYKIEFYGASIVVIDALVTAKAVLILEHSFEARNEYGGFINALKHLDKCVNFYHISVTIVCVFGALFFYNFGSVINHTLEKEQYEIF